MSRIGKQPIVILDNIGVCLEKKTLTINGPKGKLQLTIPNIIHININNKHITLHKLNQNKKTQQMYGLYRTLINNMIIGTYQGFSKHLLLQGVGYRAEINENKLILNVGYSHTVTIIPPVSVNINTVDNTHLIVSGADKALVGQVAAKIRAVRPPEPYKGKGIRYQQELIKQKGGKTGR
uniref:Ribosomal protein L6 n=1 Tax=Hildenbrandia rivularis TaxID=135206 RepID=A0A1C9CFQ7_9FLOR|nr:ribosomal protein L6 [Hildenbrandia rivularis]AOM67230.1 ribosomal protein L6 [Hildenbrandia rivularis]